MTILSKLIYLFGAIPIRLPRNYFNDLEKTITKFIWKNKRSRISRELMKKKSNEGGLAVPDLKLYYKAVVNKTIWYWLRNRPVDQWNRLGSQGKIVNNDCNLVFEKSKDLNFWDENSLFDKNCWKNWKLVWQKLGMDLHLSLYTKIRSQCLHDLGIKNEIINNLEEHWTVYLSDLWRRKEFMTKEELEITTDHKIKNFHYIKLESFCTNKTNANKIRREIINWENIFTVKGSVKASFPKYKENLL
uniref:Reverse transcriptase domain-containing protein n=1 Tax=Sarcophilus harrisii TaxID=9305 RepID=A0A7N4PJU6_SARHA